MAITDFQELALPFTQSANGTTDWMVRVADVNSVAYYLLNHCPYLGHLFDYADNEFYFDTELSACYAMVSFYAHHGKTYPHLGYLIKLQSDKIDTLTKQISGAQVMEFE